MLNVLTVVLGHARSLLDGFTHNRFLGAYYITELTPARLDLPSALSHASHRRLMTKIWSGVFESVESSYCIAHTSIKLRTCTHRVLFIYCRHAIKLKRIASWKIPPRLAGRWGVGGWAVGLRLGLGVGTGVDKLCATGDAPRTASRRLTVYIGTCSLLLYMSNLMTSVLYSVPLRFYESASTKLLPPSVHPSA